MALAEPGKVIAVADASFLIGLCMIDHFHLLEHMVEKLHLASAVWDEVVLRGAGRSGAREVHDAAIVQKQEVRNVEAVLPLKVFLGPGEAESIVLAQEVPCDILFADDLRARNAAREAGIRTMGVAGFLLAAKLRGLVQEIRPLLVTLRSKGFRLSRALVDSVLGEAGEAPLDRD